MHIRLPATLAAALLACASTQGMTVSATARRLIGVGLEASSGTRVDGRDHSTVAISALVAAEHAVLMVASILPEGEERMRALAARAIQSAEERLTLFREQPAAPLDDAR